MSWAAAGSEATRSDYFGLRGLAHPLHELLDGLGQVGGAAFLQVDDANVVGSGLPSAAALLPIERLDDLLDVADLLRLSADRDRGPVRVGADVGPPLAWSGNIFVSMLMASAASIEPTEMFLVTSLLAFP